MYLVSLQGQGTSFSPGSSGLPTECNAGTNSRSVPSGAMNLSSAALPIRVMTRIDATT